MKIGIPFAGWIEVDEDMAEKVLSGEFTSEDFKKEMEKFHDWFDNLQKQSNMSK